MKAREIRRVGYFPIVNDDVLGVAYCDVCWGNDGIAPMTEEFEEVGEDATFNYYHELDAPLHCDGCGLLIKTGLTREGYYYILDYILDPDNWTETSATWATAWSKEIDEKLINGFGELR
ncbi:MAG: hypothetical protein EBU33_09565 [Sphingobacteriia bacterium]|nr:hypothetical protein [Sphingobacteriia bacterium]